MAGPKTVFDGDECQTLVDLFEKVHCGEVSLFHVTIEEITVFEKLKDAGKFYNPLKRVDDGKTNNKR